MLLNVHALLLGGILMRLEPVLHLGGERRVVWREALGVKLRA